MAAAEVDMQAVSVCPQTFIYDQDAALAAALARIQNEQIAKLVSQHPDRFLGLATLPMQAPQQAADELRHAVRALGHAGAMIGSNVVGKNLDDPALEPVWAAAAEVDAFMLIHPVKVAGADRLRGYYLTNLIGNPLDTTIAAACLAFAGVLERYPNLKICLSHGGGFTPYQAGRFAHGWHVREEPKKSLAVSPEASLRRFYYDTILHAKPQLEFLVDWAGSSHVLLGSDYPFDMGSTECVRQVRALGVAAADRDAILGGRAAALLRGGSSARAAAAQ
jgi:aminocarboxymuconate-semialdehyde decarboxylase